MSTATLPRSQRKIEYPDSDGQPMSDNTAQFRFTIYDPETAALTVWIRRGDTLREVEEPAGWLSPRLGVRFDLSSGELQVLRPDGVPLVSYVELAEESERQRQRAERLAAQLRALGIDPDQS